MARANDNAAKFRDSLIEAQKSTNDNIATLQDAQHQANQRLRSLETNMDFTVNGIKELLANNNNAPDNLQEQDQHP